MPKYEVTVCYSVRREKTEIIEAESFKHAEIFANKLNDKIEKEIMLITQF